MLTGKGMYVWKIKDCNGGDPVSIAEDAFNSGFSHVVVKVLDGVWAYNQRPYYDNGILKYEDDIMGPFVDALHARGVQVWGFQYLYATSMNQQAENAFARCKKFGLDGFVIDAEAELKGNSLAAKTYMDKLRSFAWQTPIALSTYRYPTYHQTFPWNEFLPKVDIAMPQVYWEQASNPVYQLSRSFTEYNDILPGIPFIPTGSAYYRGSWSATPQQILDFTGYAKNSLSCPAANYWVWHYAKAINGMWDAIASFEWAPPIQPPPTETLCIEDFVIHKLYPLMQEHWGYDGPAPISCE